MLNFCKFYHRPGCSCIFLCIIWLKSPKSFRSGFYLVLWLFTWINWFRNYFYGRSVSSCSLFRVGNKTQWIYYTVCCKKKRNNSGTIIEGLMPMVLVYRTHLLGILKNLLIYKPGSWKTSSNSANAKELRRGGYTNKAG